MRTIIIAIFAAVMLTACGNSGAKKAASEADASTVYVYYFHGKQRCKTCIAVEKIAKEITSKLFSDSPNVTYIEVDITKPENEALVEQYEVGWNKLVIAKGDDYTDLTEKAFANAINNPTVLQIEIVYEISKRLEQ